MDALIMSCSTGGGHNSAAAAIAEAFRFRGHNATILDPYKLVGKNLDRKVANGYIKIAQKTPHLFGTIYKLGDLYRNLPIHSPVYAINKLMLKKMSTYLEENHFDVIFTTHIYPGEILACMKSNGISLPPRIFVATDYVCVPFTEELDCDYYVTPSELLSSDFTRRGIAEEKLLNFGIPSGAVFSQNISRAKAMAELGLDENRKYLLLSGGSIGAGLIERSLCVLNDYLSTHEDCNLIVICGNNKKLYEKLTETYSANSRVLILERTDKMHLYMKACSAYISKPGGLSSTESAVSETPLIHISPIPGCESRNLEFFSERGMSIAIGNEIEKLSDALEKLSSPEFVRKMAECQRRYINKNAATDICAFVESKLK